MRSEARRRKDRDHARRRELRRKLEAEGRPAAEIERIIAERRDQDRAERERVRSAEAAQPSDDAYVCPDDSAYRPRTPDALMTGGGRVSGITATAIRRRKALTKWEYDQLQAKASGS